MTPPLEKRCPFPLKGNEKETAFRIAGYGMVLIPLKVPKELSLTSRNGIGGI